MLTGRKKITSYLTAAYSKRLPWRKYYHICTYRVILNSLKNNAKHAWTDSLCGRLSDVTRIDRNHLAQLEKEEKEAIVAAADKTLANIFNLLGSGDTKLFPIDWSADFISGYRWPAGTYYRDYKQVDLTKNVDVKVPRELSRGHYLLHLALAYRFTKESKYADKLVELINDWIDKTPLMYSINWGCAMDVGIRAMNWIWALSLLSDYDMEVSLQAKVKNSLYQHGWFIYRNLEGTILDYNNNHYFSDIVGLLHVGLLFKNDKEGRTWLDFATREFYRELRLQILPCGMSFEGSTNYNRLMLELIVPSVVVLKRNGYRIPSDIESRIRTMFDFIYNTMMPDGEMPIVGDQDNGRGLPWGVENINDYTYIPAIGSAFFQHHCFGPARYNVYAAVFGDMGKEEFSNLPDQTKTQRSKLYYDAGLAVMRDKDNYCLLNVDNQGFYMDDSLGSGHSHADWLSFVLAMGGQTFIVDPGSYVYSSNPSERNKFRSTRMHNTIVVDGESQADVPEKELWKLPRVGNTTIKKWDCKPDIDYVEVSHNGYKRLEEPVVHQRTVLFNKKTLSFELKDIVSGKGQHRVDYYLHLDSEVVATINHSAILLSKNGVTVSLEISSTNDYDVSLLKGEVSTGYGVKKETNVVCVCGMMCDNYQLVTIIKRIG